jgi:hypothetical protein
VRGVLPEEEAQDFGLEDKDYADAGVKAAEVGGHGRYIEGGPFDEGMCRGMLLVREETFSGYDLLEEPGYISMSLGMDLR